jgi:hypothetical protein
MATTYDVVVLPGIMGSDLYYAGGNGGRTKLWYNPTNLLKQGPLSLALDVDGTSPLPTFGKKLFSVGPVSLGLYEPLMTYLASIGWDALFQHYDWRKNPLTLATQFAQALASYPLATEFQVVCHSMGGIIAQLAYPQYVALNTGKTWSQTIYLGTPFGGSSWAGLALGGQYGQGSWLNILGNVFGLGGILTAAAKYLAVEYTRVLAQTICSWPSVYTLLPNPGGPWAPIDGNASKLLLLSQYGQAPFPPYQQWLTLAAQVQAAIVSGLASPRAVETQIVGVGQDTVAQYTAGEDPGFLSSYNVTFAGDGTVEAARAMWQSKNLVIMRNTSHNQLENTAGPLAQVRLALNVPGTGNSGGDFGNDAQIPYTPSSTILAPLPLTTIPNPYPFNNRTLDP